MEDSSQLAIHEDRYTNFTALCFECHPLRYGHSTLTAKVSNQRSKETTAKRKGRNTLDSNLFRGSSETMGPLYYNSYWFQLITHSVGRTILASRSSLRSLLSAHTKLRTTGLLTGWGKVMRLLACHLWGDRTAANGPDGKGVIPWVSYFTSSPNSSYCIAQQ